ncbi:T3SS effector HopA1 family protein [Blastococcus sp. PRF04-17]|uniref:T3SS effector HopA1 family protein n=1 Tax=Blastococcus sp. PRF04-17 TaxID=2933797 RepID=UPI001FF4D30C|nr:T3SS effector HopA1 family protein [Blastococcus sp. PRF04-17]UOY00350.1 T3SS effector HopA1 family protein [Blastococcus sp. PRF04-17]
MPVALDDPPSAADMSHSPWNALIARIAEETELDGSVRIAGDLLPVSHRCRLVVETLADALYVRHFRAAAVPSVVPWPVGRRGGGEACLRLADALTPQFLGREGWTFAYRTEAGVPVFVISTGELERSSASCYLELSPAIAPEVYGRLVTALDGYGLPFRAELRGHSSSRERIGSVVVTVSRADAPALARLAIRLRQRSPFAFGRTVPAFTRPLAPGIGLADDPPGARDVGRHRFRVVATGLVQAGPHTGGAERRRAVVRAFLDACLDPAALHLNPRNPEFRLT